MAVKNSILWDTTSQLLAGLLAYSSTPKMEATFFAEMSYHFHQITRRFSQKDIILQYCV
jgi:hypothetical protein